MRSGDGSLRALLLALALVVIAGVTTPSIALGDGDGAPAAAGEPLPAMTTPSTGEPSPEPEQTPAPPGGDDFVDVNSDGKLDAFPAAPRPYRAWLARVLVPTKVWTSSDRPRRLVGKVSTVTPWGGTSQLLVLGVRWEYGNRWLRVRLHGRPNSREGWIQDDSVKLISTAWRIEVSRKTKHLRVYRAGKPARTFRVVVGKAGTPTPSGLFAIADKLRQSNPNHFIGNWALPLTAHSNVLQRFDGGDGQIGLHGRGGASLKDPLGIAASHGCVRLSNAAMNWIAEHVPTGTPVRIR